MRRGALLSLIALLGLLPALAGLALAQGGFDLSWYSVDGGGGVSSGGGYALSGVIGQPDGGTLAGGGYTLGGGFWGGQAAPMPTGTPTPVPTPVGGWPNNMYLPVLILSPAG